MAKKFLEKLGLIEPLDTEMEYNTDFSEENEEIVPELEKTPVLDPINLQTNSQYEQLFHKKNDSLITINQIYENAKLEGDARNTIFMADVFAKTLPDSLPPEVKRETVLNIMKVTSTELEALLTDAYNRIAALNSVLEETDAQTRDLFQKNDRSISELESRIEMLKTESKNRKELQEKQSHLIQFEIQKIISLVEFIKPKR